jgi:ABC-type uncharacterized transport system substrate-binding protein
VLKGKEPSEIPAEAPENQDLYLNASSAKAMGVDVLAGAEKAID